MRHLFAIAALLAVGCNNNGNGGGGHDLSMNGNGNGDMGPDLAPPADMVDITPIPAPVVKHLGSTGNTCCLVAAGATATAYLLSPVVGTPTAGELHVVTKDGTDKKVDTGVTVAGYALTPDAKSIIYTKPSGKNGSLFWADVSAATVTPRTLFNGTAQSAILAQAGFLSPSGHYFLVGVHATGVANSTDLHVIDMRTGVDVYQRLNGGFDYSQLVLPNDTLFFQDTVGGTAGGPSPVQTLYWIALPPAGAAAAAINTRTSAFMPTADNKTLLFLRSNGDLYSWDAMAKTGTGTKIASTVVKFTVGTDATGPVAYIAADGSVHVQKIDGTKLLDTPASAATSFRAPLVLSLDQTDVYFFQNGDLVTGGVQNNQGTLMRVAVQTGAMPTKVADKASTRDLQVMDNALLFLQNVDSMGQFGDAMKAARDGSGASALGMKTAVGGLAAVNPGPNTWFAMHLATAALDPVAANVPIDGSLAITGKLMWTDYLGAAELQLDATAHQGAFGFSDDGRDVAYVSGIAWNATAKNYAGKLMFLATRAPSMAIDGTLAGVTELGPVSNRSLFVNAPQAPMAGVYFVTY